MAKWLAQRKRPRLFKPVLELSQAIGSPVAIRYGGAAALIRIIQCLCLPFLLFGGLTGANGQGVLINEIMTSNGETLADENGDSPDWIELFNASKTRLDLSGYGLSDNADRPFKWVFQSAAIEPGGFLLIYASGKDRQPRPAAPLAPDTLPGLVLWLRADSVVSNDATQVRRSGANYFVRRWNDASGRGNAAIQSADTQQPLWIANGINGKPALRFDGLNDLLSLPKILATNNFCVIAVARPSLGQENDPENNGGVGGVSGQRYLFGAQHGGDFNGGAGLSMGTNGVSVYEHGSSYMPALAVYAGAVGPGFVVASVNYSARKPNLYLRGLLAREGLPSPRALVTAPVEIGSGAYGAFAGEAAEILMYNRALTDTERAGVEQHLADKYGLKFNRPLHANFQLSAQGEPLRLTKPDGTLADSLAFGPIPRDISYGRQPEGEAGWLYFQIPTPGASNTTPGSVEFISPPAFSHEAGFYTNAFELSLTVTNDGATIHYTLDGSEPGESSPVYTQPLGIRSRTGTPNDISKIPTVPGGSPPAGEVFKGWAVRARAFKPGMLPSDAATQTYWIDPRGRRRYSLPVISLATHRTNLFDPQVGIYVPGNAPSGNYSQRGPEWERPVHVEFCETNNFLAFAQEASVKIHGNTSQGFPIKGLDLDGTGGKGRQPFRYPIFPDRARQRFGSFLLRPTGHDQPTAFMRDEFMQSLAAETGAESQAARACVVFINGEYWGLHYLKEKEDAEFVGYYGDRPEEELDYLEGYAMAKAGDINHYQAMINYMAANDLSLEAAYAQVQTWMEVPNYIDYKACEIFYYRWDIGNHRLWRPRTPEGRWRWLQFDNDVGWGGFWAIQPAWQFNMLSADLTPSGSLNGHNSETTTFLLRQLMLNANFRRDFINRFADLLNTIFQPGHTLARINQMASVLDPEMSEHIYRWRSPASLAQWRSNVQYMRDYANQRPSFMRQHLLQQFVLKGTAQLSLAVSDTNHGGLRVNTLTVRASETAPWAGLYFKGNPITLEAVPSPGYRFKEWQGLLGVDQTHMTLMLNGDLTVKAVFERVEIKPLKFASILPNSEGAIQLQITGPTHQALVLQSSIDLRHWTDGQTIRLDATGQGNYQIEKTASALSQFFRLMEQSPPDAAGE